MNKAKKIILCLLLIFVLTVGICFVTYYYFKLNKVVTVLTMDINPSIKVSLNYKNDIVKSEGLNKEGKELLKDNKFEGNSLKTAMKDFTKLVIEKDYINEIDNFILVNIEGKNIENEVINLIKSEFKNNNTNCSVIVQKITAQAKENAEKYGISENKAGYIESLIKENSNITFEDLAKKSINEINKIIKEKNVETENQQEFEEQNNEEKREEEQTPSVNNNSNEQGTQKIYKVPANDDRTGAWCDFIASLPQEGGVSYETPGIVTDLNKFFEVAKNSIKDDLDVSGFSGSTGGWYRKGSYCSAGVIIVYNTTKTKKYKVYIDSVTLEMLELIVTEIEKPKIDEDAAKVISKKWVLDTYGVDIDNCDADHYNYYYVINGITDIPEWQFSVKCNNPVRYYSVIINGLTGELKNGRTWN